MSGKTKRVQQAKRAFGTTENRGGRDLDVGTGHGWAQESGCSEIQLVNLPRLLQTFQEQIWLVVPTTNVSDP